MENIWLIIIALISLVLGSLPFAYWIGGEDVLRRGSGNVGAMNVLRVVKSKILGVVLFISDMMLDAAKSYLALWISQLLAPFFYYDAFFGLIVAAIFVIFGHNYSLFLKFQGGGKGLSSLWGILCFLNLPIAFICLAIMLVAVLTEKFLLKPKNASPKDKFEGGAGEISKALGDPILGRVIGMIVCVIVLAFLLPQEFFAAILSAISLSFIAHIERLREYLKQRVEK